MHGVTYQRTLPDQVDRSLSDYAHRAGAKKSTVVVGAVREWLRMEAHPGIVFVTTATGERRAALPGLDDRRVVAPTRDVRAHGRTVADALGLTVADVETALAYWADYRTEIDDIIEREHASQDDALAAWGRRQALDAV